MFTTISFYRVPKRTRKGKLPRIASTQQVVSTEQNSRLLLEQMIKRNESTIFAGFSRQQSPSLHQSPSLYEKLREKLKTSRPRSTADDQQDYSSKQRIINVTNRALLIKFAEKNKPKNASLSKRQRLNLRLAANNIANPLKPSESLIAIDKILDLRQKLKGLTAPRESDIKSDRERRVKIGERLKARVHRQIELSRLNKNISVLSL